MDAVNILEYKVNSLRLQINQAEWRLEQKGVKEIFLKVILMVAIIVNCIFRYIKVYFA